MTPTTAPRPHRSKLTFYLAGNLCIALVLFLAVPVIHNSRQGYVPHAELNKEYVNAAIASGSVEFMHKALKTTETYRAMGYQSQVNTMQTMMLAIGALGVLFLLNGFLLFRLHKDPARAPSAA